MKKRISILISIFTTFLLVLSVTYALYKWSGTDNTDIKFDANLEIVYQTESNNITGTLAPSTDKSVGLNTDVKFWTKSNNTKVYGNIYLNVENIDETLTETDVLKWEVWNNSIKINEGSFAGIQNENDVKIVDNTELKTVEDNYEVYIWLDETKATSEMSNVNLETNVYAEASQVEYADVLYCNISGKIRNWSLKTTLTGNVSSNVTGYAWTNSTTIPSEWTPLTVTPTKEVTENSVWYLHIKDINNNTMYCTTNVTKIDTTSPTITDLNVVGDGGAQTITVTITASDTQSGIGNYYYSLDNETFIASTNPNYTWTGQVPGTYTVYTYVKDKLGNQTIILNKSIVVEMLDMSGATSPFLPDEMISIKHNGTDWVKVDSANNNTDWYNYDNKMWANAVMVNSTSRATITNASVGTPIAETDILAYYVWIPRYRYKLWNVEFAGSSPQEIDIVFESPSDVISNGTINGEYLSHPAFWWDNNSNGIRETGEELSGIWVGKFETTGTSTTPTVKPNVASLVRQNVSTQFTTAKKLRTSTYLTTTGVNQVDSHMMKNMEWGAVTYLSHSKYGINTEIGINNNDAYITGCGASPGTSSASTCNTYNTTTGMLASTTGNITGIYDMSGGAFEYVMGVMQDNTNTNKPMSGTNVTYNSGFTGKTYDTGNFTTYTGTSFPTKKYYDLYAYGTANSSFIKKVKLGDATGETRSWYSDYTNFVYSNSPWFLRGGYYDYGSSAGAFNFHRDGGNANNYSFRSILITP